jgi:hypothetical protein
MSRKLAWGRSFLISGLITLLIHAIVGLPRIARLLQPLSERTATPVWLLQAGVAVGLFLTVELTIYSKWAYRLWIAASRSIDWHIFKGSPSLFFGPHGYYSSDQKHYGRALSHCMLQSQFMFCILLSGHTMRHGREEFMHESFGQIPRGSRTDIRMLFLNRESAGWVERAQQLVAQKDKGSPSSVDEFRFECEAFDEVLRNNHHALVAFYERRPSWRMYLFDDRLFLSRYFDPPHKERMMVYYRGDIIYEWLYREFWELCPKHWTDVQSASAFAESCDLRHYQQQISREARLIWEKRVVNGVVGDEKSDWLQAETKVRAEIKAHLLAKLVPEHPPPHLGHQDH